MGHVSSMGGVSRHALARRIASLGGVVATTATMLFIMVGNAAASPTAQINISALICAILAALQGLFGGIFGGIFGALLARFGCVVPSG